VIPKSDADESKTESQKSSKKSAHFLRLNDSRKKREIRFLEDNETIREMNDRKDDKKSQKKAAKDTLGALVIDHYGG